MGEILRIFHRADKCRLTVSTSPAENPCVRLIPIGEPASVGHFLICGHFIARHVNSPRGDGELWFADWNRCTFEGTGRWIDVIRAVLGAEEDDRPASLAVGPSGQKS